MKLLANILIISLAWSASAAELRPLKYISLPSKKPLTDVQISRLGKIQQDPANEYARVYRRFHELAIDIEDRYEQDKTNESYAKVVAAMSKFAKDRAWADFASLQPAKVKPAREKVFLGMNPYCKIVEGGLFYEPCERYGVSKVRQDTQDALADFGLSDTQRRYRQEQKRFNDEINDRAAQYESQVPKDDKVALYRARKKALKQARKESWFHTGILEGIKHEARENGEEWPDYEP